MKDDDWGTVDTGWTLRRYRPQWWAAIVAIFILVVAVSVVLLRDGDRAEGSAVTTDAGWQSIPRVHGGMS